MKFGKYKIVLEDEYELIKDKANQYDRVAEIARWFNDFKELKCLFLYLCNKNPTYSISKAIDDYKRVKHERV